MQKGTVLINVHDIMGEKVCGYVVWSYRGKTYSHTRGGDRARHWYLCKCQKCGNERVFRRDQIVSRKLPKCRVPHKKRKRR